jgi:hypothetical protein
MSDKNDDHAVLHGLTLIDKDGRVWPGDRRCPACGWEPEAQP